MSERILSLFGGKLRRWVKARESRDPEAVYESAIADRVRRYQQLKSAAAGVIYMRSKLERDLKRKTTELVEVAEQAVQAADMNEDQCALILLRRKHELEDETERLKEELTQLTTEAEDAKKNLIAFKDEIEKLKVEKIRMMARLRNAQARVRIQQALESFPTTKTCARSRKCASRSSRRSRRPASTAKCTAPRSTRSSTRFAVATPRPRRRRTRGHQAPQASPAAPLDLFAKANFSGNERDALSSSSGGAR